ncbi:MAG: hypothetical protein LRZ85_09125 [Alphaproteobacteria bacterium]|nr:hypothetical protein [Alphaproteobacteria bacterium]
MKHILFAFMLVFFAASVSAEEPDAAPGAPPAAEEKVDLKAAENFKEKAEDLKEDLSDKLGVLEKRLNDKERHHFGIIYNNHNLIQTVKTVEGDVGNAVSACSRENPDMASKMEDRFDDWKTAVNAKLTEAEGLTQSMIFAQDYATKDEINDALAAADTLRAHSQTIYDKVPVTSEEACEFLYEKMVETKDNMLMLISTTLISVPQEMQKVEEPASEEFPEETAEETAPAEEDTDAAAEDAPAEEEVPSESDEEPAE